MVKKYYCDVCDVRIQNNPDIIKKHNQGLQHQTAKFEHYAKYRTVASIIEDERKKQPCSRALNSSCAFGAYCRFSHFSEIQLKQLELDLKIKDFEYNMKLKNRTVEEFLSRRLDVQAPVLDENLPVSLQKMDFKKLEQMCDDNKHVTDWG